MVGGAAGVDWDGVRGRTSGVVPCHSKRPAMLVKNIAGRLLLTC
jgi:hypothetical protein